MKLMKVILIISFLLNFKIIKNFNITEKDKISSRNWNKDFIKKSRTDSNLNKNRNLKNNIDYFYPKINYNALKSNNQDNRKWTSQNPSILTDTKWKNDIGTQTSTDINSNHEKNTQQSIEKSDQKSGSQNGISQNTQQSIEKSGSQNGISQNTQQSIEKSAQNGISQNTQQSIEKSVQKSGSQNGISQNTQQSFEKSGSQNGISQNTQQSIEKSALNGISQNTQQSAEKSAQKSDSQNGISQNTQQSIEKSDPQNGISQNTQQSIEKSALNGISQNTQQSAEKSAQKSDSQNGISQNTQQSIEKSDPQNGISQNTQQSAEKSAQKSGSQNGISQNTQQSFEKSAQKSGSQNGISQNTQQSIEKSDPQNGISQNTQQSIEKSDPQNGISQNTQQSAEKSAQNGISQNTQQSAEKSAQKSDSQNGISQNTQQSFEKSGPQNGISQNTQQSIEKSAQNGISQNTQQSAEKSIEKSSQNGISNNTQHSTEKSNEKIKTLLNSHLKSKINYDDKYKNNMMISIENYIDDKIDIVNKGLNKNKGISKDNTNIQLNFEKNNITFDLTPVKNDKFPLENDIFNHTLNYFKSLPFEDFNDDFINNFIKNSEKYKYKQIGKGGFGFVFEIESNFNKDFVIKCNMNKKNNHLFEKEIEFHKLFSSYESYLFMNLYGVIKIKNNNYENICVLIERINGDLTDKKIENVINTNIIQIYNQLKLAIKILHFKGYAHRDIKEINIFYKQNSEYEDIQIKLGDYGIAYNVNDSKYYVGGTIHYMKYGLITKDANGNPLKEYTTSSERIPKEQIFYNDVYAVGITLYQIYFKKNFNMEHFNAKYSNMINYNPKEQSLLVIINNALQGKWFEI